MQVAILAGGLATRLEPWTREVPKSMIRICGRPFLEYQLDFLKKNGITNIVLCVGYLGKQIENHFDDGNRFEVNIRYSDDGERLLGTAGALKKAENLLDDEFFVMYGDSYLFLHFGVIMSYFRELNGMALMVVYKNHNQCDASNVVLEGNLIKQYNKGERTKDMVYIDYGASILKKSTLELMRQNQVYSLEELFAQLIKQKELLAYEVDKRFYQIGSAQGLKEFEKFIFRSEGAVQ